MEFASNAQALGFLRLDDSQRKLAQILLGSFQISEIADHADPAHCLTHLILDRCEAVFRGKSTSIFSPHFQLERAKRGVSSGFGRDSFSELCELCSFQMQEIDSLANQFLARISEDLRCRGITFENDGSFGVENKHGRAQAVQRLFEQLAIDRKSKRLNSSH